MINPWGLILTIFVFEFAKKLKSFTLFSKTPPMLITVLVLITLLCCFNIDYAKYNESACGLTLLLGPATIALALPLFDNVKLLTRNKRAVYFGFVVAVLTALGATIILGQLFHADWQLIVSMLPKSVTTPIAVEVSKMIGGIPELTACMVVLTGLFGALFGHKILKLAKIKSDIATGLAIGAASHVLGTSSCIERRKHKQVVMATLALIVIGILTTIACVCVF